MLPEQRAIFANRASRLKNVHAITFNARLESLMARAAGVVAMGGYNTFCEILSFDKRALIVPRTAPRLEQFIRARRAAELGLLTMLTEAEGRDPRVMATALRRLTEQPPPSTVDIPGLLEGMTNSNRLVRKWLNKGRAGCFAARERLEA
jgi:predicted glycosyltransferase